MVDNLPLTSFETDIYIERESLETFSFRDQKHEDVFYIDNFFDVEKKPIIEITPHESITKIELTNNTLNVSVEIPSSGEDKITIESNAVYIDGKEVEATFTGMFIVDENSTNKYTIKITPADVLVDIDFKILIPKQAITTQYFIQNITIDENKDYYTISGGIVNKKSRDFILTNTSYAFSIGQLWYNNDFLLDDKNLYRIKLQTINGVEEPLTLHLCGCKFEELGYEERDGERTRKNLSGLCLNIFKN